MTPDQEQSIRTWMEARFDRIDDKMDHAIQNLAEEIRTTRHGQREVSEQLARQMVVLQENAQHDRLRIIELERRTGEEGPIDLRFRRHDGRIAAVATAQQASGKFTWGDVWRVAAGMVAVMALLGGMFSMAKLLAANAPS